MRVQIAYVGPGTEVLLTLDVAPGATVGAAVAQSGIAERIDVSRGALGYAIFGRRVAASEPLADGDRIEITRPLAADPKLARRRRAAATRKR
jgi:putative ubiquitin-RnfH superfamily antitoxin RatB of RatAB toxin-antitoxin module